MMRAIPSLALSVSRTLWNPAASSSCKWTSVRHGSQRTLGTPHYDPKNWTRDRSQKIPRSLYYQEDDWVQEPVYPDIEPRKRTLAWVKFTREKEAKEIEKLSLKQKMDHFTFAPPLKTVRPREHRCEFRRRFWQPYEITGFPELYHVTPFYQYITKTAIVSDQLPQDYYSFLDEVALKDILDKIREPVTLALMTERKYYVKNMENVPEEDRDVVIQAQNVIDAITRAVDLAAGRNFPHVYQLQRDLETKCSAHWKRSGYTEGHANFFTRDAVSGEVQFQYVEDGMVFRLFRHELPLPEVVPRTSSLVTARGDALDVPVVNEIPRTHGFVSKKYLPHWIPGFWFGDPCEFSTLSLTVPRKWTNVVERLGEDSACENLAANAVIAGFGRVVAQAMYLGFTFLNELTYPIVTQSILTNGRDWVFSTYQANTIAVWKQDSDNPYRNLAWITKPLRLFETIEEDKVVGLNDEVLKNIVRQYLKAPCVDPQLNLRPFVGEPVRSYWKNEKSRVPFYHQQKRRDNKLRQPYKPEI